MPMYEYVCVKCGHAFETLVRLSQADEPQPCPSCGYARTQRQMSSFAMGGGASRSSAGISSAPAVSPFR